MTPAARAGVGRFEPENGAIVIVAYQGIRYLRATVRSCILHGDGVPIYLVDNASTDGGPDVVGDLFPAVHILRQPRNLGYAGGSNAGIAAALEGGASWVFLLNQDAELGHGVLRTLADVLTTTPRAGAVQPAIFREDGLINSAGNPFHYLGFSAAGGNGRTLGQVDTDPSLPWLAGGRWRLAAVEVPACSGAAVMLRSQALADVGMFEPELFLYHEDVELSFRLRAGGWTLWLAGNARVLHRYEFSRNLRKWYFMERNRIWILLAHYRASTLAALALPFLAAELAVWAAAVRGGWAHEKLASYRYWLEPGRLDYVRGRRAQMRRTRRVSDRDLLAVAATRIDMAQTSAATVGTITDRTSAALWWLIRTLVR